MSLRWVDDDKLTPYQKTLKWVLYCESDWEKLEDIQVVLESLLNDVKNQLSVTKITEDNP